MKVLMLGWELPPHFVGGMGTVCYSLCEFLAKSGADIEFILPFEGDYDDVDFMKVNPYTDSTTSSISYKDLDRVNATAYGKVDISTEKALQMNVTPFDEIHDIYLEKVARVMVIGGYDVIHAHDWLTMRAGMMAKRVSGAPLIVHIHATEFDRAGADEFSRGNEMIHEIEYEGMMMANKIITVSQLTKNLIMRRYDIPESKISVVHNSIDLESPYLHANDHPVDQYAGLKKLKDNGYKIVLNVGRQTIQKGLTQLLETAKLVIDRNPKVMFLLIGNGDQHLELVTRAAELGISKNIVFTGFQSGVRARDAFKLADAFLMPSLSEPFGTTALEAMGFGTPVLVSHQSGVSEMISTAFKADFWDTRVLADRLLGVLTHESLAHAMSEAGVREVENTSYANTAAGTLSVYHQAIGAMV